MFDWKKEIFVLSGNLCLCESKVRDVIRKTEKNYPNRDSEYLYNKAWSALKPLIMAI